jgi:hypothetical protein
MSDSYLHLPPQAQREVLEAAVAITNRSAAILEKDIWLSFLLHHLFSMPGRKPMAFKGGTSLSKVYSVIDRFSEDVDITIDYRSLGHDQPLSVLLSHSSRHRGRVSDSLREQVELHLSTVVMPYLKHQIAALPCAEACAIKQTQNGEALEVHYPSRAQPGNEYLRNHVLLEFGGRNIIDPNAIFDIAPDIARVISGVSFPSAKVVVLAAERTFWEKATLIHAACNRPVPEGLNRYSRHWYDLAMLARHDCGRRAKTDIALLRDVVELKNTFYWSGFSNYSKCLSGELNLIPDEANRRLLRADFEAMTQAAMFHSETDRLDVILEELRELQREINQATMEWYSLG